MSEYGKFNSAEELLKGYNELERSFTQKCQQLARLQQQADSAVQTQNAFPAESDIQQQSGTSDESAISPSPQETATQGAVSSVANDAATVPSQTSDVSSESRPDTAPEPPRVMSGGGNVSCALPNRPKTLKEASDLAKKIFS